MSGDEYLIEPHEDEREEPPPAPPPPARHVNRQPPAGLIVPPEIILSDAQVRDYEERAARDTERFVAAVEAGGVPEPVMLDNVDAMVLGGLSPSASLGPTVSCTSSYLKEQFRSDSSIHSLEMSGTEMTAVRTFVVKGWPDVALQRTYNCYPLGSTWTRFSNTPTAVSIPLLRVVGYSSQFYLPKTSRYPEAASWVTVRYGTTEESGQDIEWSIGPGTIAVEVRHDNTGALLSDSETAQILLPAITFEYTRTEDDWGFMDAGSRVLWNPSRWSWGPDALGTPGTSHSQYRRSRYLTGCVNGDTFLSDSTGVWLYLGATVQRSPNPFHVYSGYYQWRVTYHFACNPQRKSGCSTVAGWQVWHRDEATAKDIYCQRNFASLQLAWPTTLGGAAL